MTRSEVAKDLEKKNAVTMLSDPESAHYHGLPITEHKAVLNLSYVAE